MGNAAGNEDGEESVRIRTILLKGVSSKQKVQTKDDVVDPPKDPRG